MNWIVNAAWAMLFFIGIVMGMYMQLNHKAYMKRHNYQPPLLD